MALRASFWADIGPFSAKKVLLIGHTGLQPSFLFQKQKRDLFERKYRNPATNPTHQTTTYKTEKTSIKRSKKGKEDFKSSTTQ